MSMSQEEIEALMGGAGDFSAGDDSVSEESGESIDDILAGIDGIIDDGSEDSEENFDDILAGIDGISDNSNSQSSSSTDSSNSKKEEVNEGQYPMPLKQENKVVSQLNQVADDSEQKASQIFDVLSFVLDENNEIQKFNKEIIEFTKEQEELLTSLHNKFPNISVFEENLQKAQSIIDVTEQLNQKVDSENMKIFEAMELMQFHDINRQKIERVMAVIRKLNDYLNGIFEDDTGKTDIIPVAKHISGDSNEIVESEDIEALISEFSKGE